jgi:hypothetical protein
LRLNWFSHHFDMLARTIRQFARFLENFGLLSIISTASANKIYLTNALL